MLEADMQAAKIFLSNIFFVIFAFSIIMQGQQLVRLIVYTYFHFFVYKSCNAKAVIQIAGLFYLLYF